MAQQRRGRSLGPQRRAGVVLAGRVWQAVGLCRRLRVPEGALDGQSAGYAHGAQVGGGGEEGAGALAEDAHVQFSLDYVNTTTKECVIMGNNNTYCK